MEVKSHEVIVRFALMHLIATNTSVWLRTLINEIMFEYEHFQHHDDDHHGDSPADNSTPGLYDIDLSLSCGKRPRLNLFDCWGSALLMHVVHYPNPPGSSTDAGARHVRFPQIVLVRVYVEYVIYII